MSSPVNDSENVICLEEQKEDIISHNPEEIKECEGDPSDIKSCDDLTLQTVGGKGDEVDEADEVGDTNDAPNDSQNVALKANSNPVSELENDLEDIESGDINWEGLEVVDEFNGIDGTYSSAAERSPGKSNSKHDRENLRSSSRSQSRHRNGNSRWDRNEDKGCHWETHTNSDRNSKCVVSESKETSKTESKERLSKEKQSDDKTSKAKLQSMDSEVDQDKEDEPHRNEREWKKERNNRAVETQAKEMRERKQRHNKDGFSNTNERSQPKKFMRTVSCRSSWKNFKKVLLVSDSRIPFDEPSLKECCRLDIQVLSKPCLTLDDVPALVSTCIEQGSKEETLLICSVGTYDLIKLEDSDNCKELLHEPFKCISIRSKANKDPEMDIIRKTKILKKKLQQLLGSEAEVYFTSILPFSFSVYQEFQTSDHKNATEHDVVYDINESDLKDWELKVHKDISLFNEYHLNTYPVFLSLHLANLTQCLVKNLKNYFETCTVDGLNFKEEVSREVTTNLGNVINKYCTRRGRYERVILVGDSRLDCVRRAWPLDVRYNCKFLTYPDLELKQLCDPGNQVVKELSHSHNSLIVICVGLYDMCNNSVHPECASTLHKKNMLEILLPANFFKYNIRADDVKRDMCRIMVEAANNLRSISNNCDVIFSTIYDFDCLSHETLSLIKHEEETKHVIQNRILKLSTTFNYNLKCIVSAVTMFNKIALAYSQTNSLPVWDNLSVVSDQVLVYGKYCPISDKVLWDGIHPSPAVAELLAKKYRALTDDALMMEAASKDVERKSLDDAVDEWSKSMMSLRMHDSNQWRPSDKGQEKTGDVLDSDRPTNSSLKMKGGRRSSQTSTHMREGERIWSPSKVSDSGSSGPLDDAERRRRRSRSPSFSRKRNTCHEPVSASYIPSRYPEQDSQYLQHHTRSYRRSLSTARRSRSRSVSPIKHHLDYRGSISYTEGYSRSPSPLDQGRRQQTSSYYARRNSFVRSSVSPTRWSPSPSNDKHWRIDLGDKREEKALSTLRDVHNQECAVYRKHPLAHPDHDREYRLFRNKKWQCIIDLGGDPNTYDMSGEWHLLWPTRLEQLLEESWIVKRDKCLALLRGELKQSKRKNRSRSSSSSEDSKSHVNKSKKRSKSSRKANDHKGSKKSPEVKNRRSDIDDNKSLDDVKHNRDSILKGNASKDSVSEEEISKCHKENQLERINSEEAAVSSINPEKKEVKKSPSIDGKSANNPDQVKTGLGTVNMKISEGSSSKPETPPLPQHLLKTSVSNLKPERLDMIEMPKEKPFAQNPENNLDKWRNRDPEESLVRSVSKEESADEVSSTTPSIEDVKHDDFISVLEILNRMGDKFGILKLPLKVVFDKALQYQSKGMQPSELLKVKDTMILFVMINEKLKKLANEGNLNIIIKVVLQEASQRLSKILKALEPELDIPQIAQKCLGKNESDTVSYIQREFSEQGITKPTNDQLREVFEAVRQERSKLLTQILKQTSIGTSLNIQSSDSLSAPAPMSEDVKYSPTQAGWSDDDSLDACFLPTRSRLVVSKDNHNNTKDSNVGVPHFPASKEVASFASQNLVEPAKQIDVSLSSIPVSKQEPAVNTQLSAALSRLNRNMYGSLPENYEGKNPTKTWSVLSSSLDYGLISPSTSKEQFSQSLDGYSSSDNNRSNPPKALVSIPQRKVSGESSVSRKDPIRLVIPKGKIQGQNLSLPNPMMDDSGWQ